jgi:hypothetical protein
MSPDEIEAFANHARITAGDAISPLIINAGNDPLAAWVAAGGVITFVGQLLCFVQKAGMPIEKLRHDIIQQLDTAIATQSDIDRGRLQ